MPTLLIGAPTQGLVGVDADLDAMAAILPACGLEPAVVVRDATLAAIRGALAELLARTGAGAPVLLYLTGHGGFVANRAHDPHAERPAPPRLHYFRTVPGPGGGDEALFDVELSLWCARLAAKTANVVVVIDCCHAGGMIRAAAAEQAFVAGFAAWRAAHQDEIDELDVEAHPDVVRLAAAGVNGAARAGEAGSALTTCLRAALAEPGALQSSWLGLFARIEAHMAMSGAAQQPRLSGPVRRRVFQPIEVPPAEERPVGAAQVVRRTWGGASLAALGLRLAWGCVRDGRFEPRSGPAAHVGDDDALYVRVTNLGEERRFVAVLWVPDDGEAVLLSRSEAMGVELDGRTTYICGDRPFARRPRGVVPPRRALTCGERRGERLVVVGTTRRQALRSAVQGVEDGRAADLAGVEVVSLIVSKPETGSHSCVDRGDCTSS